MTENVFVLAQAAGGGNPLVMFFPIIIVVVMFFFLFRGQQKENKRRKEMLNNVKSGDKVVSSGGLHGIVTNVKEQSFLVKIADNVKVEIAKNGIATVLDKDNFATKGE